MRKGIDSLCGLVKNELGKDPLSGELFVFFCRARRRVKLLLWEEDGYALYHKRLERGTFEAPNGNTRHQSISSEQLTLLLFGVNLKKITHRFRYQHRSTMHLCASLAIIFAMQVSKNTNIDALSKEELVSQVRDLQHQIALLQKLVFGPRSDRFKVADEAPANQLSLGMATEAIAEVEVKKTTMKEHDRTKVRFEAKKHPGRTPLPSSLRREVIVIEPGEDVTGLTRLPDEVTEVLEAGSKLPSFYVKQYRRPKYVTSWRRRTTTTNDRGMLCWHSNMSMSRSAS